MIKLCTWATQCDIPPSFGKFVAALALMFYVTSCMCSHSLTCLTTSGIFCFYSQLLCRGFAMRSSDGQAMASVFDLHPVGVAGPESQALSSYKRR